MRFLLINPYCPISENPSPSLGLAFLAGALEEAGIETRVIDFTVFPFSKKILESVLRDFRPNLVGATSVTMTYDSAAQIIQAVKALNPDILTVMGGPHVTFWAEGAMNSLPELDFVVLGEGEHTAVDLVRETEQGRDWSRIKGIVYRQGPEVVRTGPREPTLELDSLPVPARHYFPLGRYRALGMPITMTTSRGCPFQCIFCVGRKMVGARVRYRNPKKVVDELEYLCGLNFQQINIVDDLFTASKDHCLAVCHEIRKRKLKANWTSFSRVDTISRELLIEMKKAGCYAVSFGVETGNPDILKTLKKKIDLEQVLEAANLCREVGVEAHFTFILGLPGETPETLRQTVDFGEKIGSIGGSSGFHLLAPFPGTEIREKMDALGLSILTHDWSQYHANRAIVETPSVTKKMLDELVISWEKKYLDRLGLIKQRREKGEVAESEAWELTKLEHIAVINDLMMSRAVEEKGTWPRTDRFVSEEDSLDRLVDRVWNSTDSGRDQVHKALSFAVGQGNLICSTQNGLVCWTWLDYLNMESERIPVTPTA
ncbi:MAG: B12-binding domain-containing radical SAM protein [Deltaproteobacteria bacterium RBG_13_43_22]|nr:MAG: B12-binding domain-containing radical SAM protein [Deltaproteobacteria bacterium RBG_13_43_22]